MACEIGDTKGKLQIRAKGRHKSTRKTTRIYTEPRHERIRYCTHRIFCTHKIHIRERRPKIVPPLGTANISISVFQHVVRQLNRSARGQAKVWNYKKKTRPAAKCTRATIPTLHGCWWFVAFDTWKRPCIYHKARRRCSIHHPLPAHITRSLPVRSPLSAWLCSEFGDKNFYFRGLLLIIIKTLHELLTVEATTEGALKTGRPSVVRRRPQRIRGRRLLQPLRHKRR